MTHGHAVFLKKKLFVILSAVIALAHISVLDFVLLVFMSFLCQKNTKLFYYCPLVLFDFFNTFAQYYFGCPEFFVIVNFYPDEFNDLGWMCEVGTMKKL